MAKSNLKRIALPSRSVDLYVFPKEVPEGTINILLALYKHKFTSYVDLICILNVLEDIEGIENYSFEAKNFAIAVLLSNFNDLIFDNEEKEILIEEFSQSNFCFTYIEDKQYWISDISRSSIMVG